MENEPIEKIMNKPMYVRETDLATKVRYIFRKSGYRSLPVVDEKEKLIGIITMRDMLNVTSTRSNLTAKGIMSSPMIYLTPDEELLGVAKKMLRANLSRAMVVTSKQGMKLVGVVSTHDILKKLCKKGPCQTKLIKEIMHTNVATCSPNDPITKVWGRMEEIGCTGMPVVKKKVVGIITRWDIIDAGFARIRREGESGRSRVPVVEKVMRTPAVSITPSAKVGDAAAIMIKNNIASLPVIEEERGKLVGLIDRNDIIRQYVA